MPEGIPVPTPLGAHSPKLDEVRALRTKAGRREQRRFAIEGPTLLDEALRAGISPEAVYVTERAYETLPQALARVEDRLFTISERAAARISELETPSGVLAVLPWALESPDGVLATGAPGLVLAGVGDPGNAGTLLRSAEIFGLEAVLFMRGAVEPYNPKVVRASMGAVFRLRLAAAEPRELCDAARARGYAIVAAGQEGQPLPEFRFPERCLIAIGGERRGVAGSLSHWDSTVAIPQRGRGESLNAAVAGSIILYAFSQQTTATVQELQRSKNVDLSRLGDP